MSNYTGYGTLAADGATTEVACRGWATLTAQGTWGGGTITWQYKGLDGTWRTILAGTDNITAQAYTADNMLNVFFGSGVRIRGTVSGSTTPDLDWQIMSNPWNRTS